MFNIARYCPILPDIVQYHPISQINHSLGKIDIVGLLDIFKYRQIMTILVKYSHVFSNMVRYLQILSDIH